MKHHLNYLKYVLRHKWYVLIAGRMLGVSFWQVLVHDLSKFNPKEWCAYVDYFHRYKENRTPYIQAKFKAAWLHHLHHNPHHAGHWSLFTDYGGVQTIPMPDRFIREMVADWAGAGRAITGTWEVGAWYKRNMDSIPLNTDTRFAVEYYINYFEEKKCLSPSVATVLPTKDLAP